MTVLINTPQQVGVNSWRVSWSSSLLSPTYYIYRDGILLATTTGEAWTFTLSAGESLRIFISDTLSDSPESGYPGRLILQWQQTDNTAYYLIYEYIDSAWVLRSQMNDIGNMYNQWQTRFLEDGQTHQFKIVPVGTNGNTGIAVELSALMVRYPDPPDVAFEYNGSATPTLTITEN